jgi:hypothetical protein
LGPSTSLALDEPVDPVAPSKHLLTTPRGLLPPHAPAAGYYLMETSSILQNVVTALSADASKTFQWVESVFLQRWWQDQNATTRATFKRFVDEGRIELLGGGWTMHDGESGRHPSSASAASSP